MQINQTLSDNAMRMQMDPPSATLRALKIENLPAVVRQYHSAVDRGDEKHAEDLKARASALMGEQS